MPTALIDRYRTVQSRIHSACVKANRAPDTVRLIAVSKLHPAEDIRILALSGQLAFGENYVQELTAKVHALDKTPIEWHFIGPLQSNKCKEIATTAYMMHSLDRVKLIAPLAHFRPEHMPPLKVLLQVNMDDEHSKSGVQTFNELLLLAQAVIAHKSLDLQGLMTIPAPCTDPIAQSRPFAQLREWRDRLSDTLNLALPELSMGMSVDLEAAIAEGATMVRVGTDIFGARPTQSHLT